MKNNLVLTSICIALTSGLAFGAPPETGKKHKGMQDKDGDGKITVADFPEKKKKHFSKIDTDGNGEISEDEKKAVREKMKARRGDPKNGAERRGMKDRDGDGKITVADFPEKRKAHFSKIDTDGDGEISENEKKAVREKMKARRKAKKEAKQ